MYQDFMGEYGGISLGYEAVTKVYKNLEDQESRDVFNASMEYLFDGNWHKFLKLGGPISFTSFEFDEWYKKNGRELPIVIFGTDGDGRYVAKLLRGQNYPVIAYCSNDEKIPSSSLDEMPVWSFEKLCANAGKNVIFLASSRFTHQLYEQCIYITPLDSNLIFYPPRRRYVAYRRGQYFDFFKPSRHEIFVDGGAYNAETTVDFVKWAREDYDMAYVFEANKQNLNMCKKTLIDAGVDKYSLIMKGLWDKQEQITFAANPTLEPASRVSAIGEWIQGTSIDEELSGKRVSFLKLDIEGSEFKALIGAKQTIKKWRPKLAISIYHKKEDFVVLPLLILQLLPEYHLAMRSYTSSDEERVLYAWTD